ncbi:MAG: glutaredoxin domain-containing protein [Polyangiaceae bacterium]
MEARRCGTHGLVVGADGKCVICKRGELDVPPPKTSSELPIVLMLLVIGALLIGGVAYALGRRIQDMQSQRVPPPEAPTAVESEAVEAPPPKNPFEGQKTRAELPDEPVVSVTPTATELTDEELDKLKRRVPITMFVGNDCGLCQTARLYLKSKNYNVRELNIDASETDKVLLQSVNAAGTVPTFDVDGRILVGYEKSALESALEDMATKKRR